MSDYTDFYVGFFTKQHQAEKQYTSPLTVGDPVKVTGPECTGQVGELAVIEEEDVYGVWLDTVGQQMFFSREELERADLAVDMAELPF